MKIVATPYYARLLERLDVRVKVVDPGALRRVKADVLVVPWDIFEREGERGKYRARHVVPGSVASFSEAMKTGLRVGLLAGLDAKKLVGFVASILDEWSEFAPVEGEVRSEKRFVRELCWDLGIRVSERGMSVKPDYEGGELPSHGFEDPLDALRTRAEFLISSLHRGTR